MAHAAHIAAHAEALKNKQAEEEEMTSYKQTDLNEDWEFKIVRSATGNFKKPKALEMLRAEEAMAGWKLVEKFDDNRIRFKRPADAYKKDALLPPGMDPYRTQFGMSEGGLAFRVIVAIFVAIGLVMILLYYVGALS